MKHSKVKNAFITATAVLLAFCFVMLVVLSRTELNVFAATSAEQEKVIDYSEQDAEKMIAATREEYSDLQEYPYDEEIAGEMDKLGTTVGESLVDAICHYQEMLAIATDEQEIEKINSLIDGTKNILDTYQNAALQKNTKLANYDINSVGVFPPFDAVWQVAATAVPAAIAFFTAANYSLSAELLTHAWVENFFPGTYEPINGDRVVGSQATYSFVNSNKTSSGLEFPIYMPNIVNTATCYEEDLGLALHACDVTRSNADSTIIQITDVYDFGVTDSGNAILDALVGVFAAAQYYGIIGDYEVQINVDIADPLYLELEDTTNGVHTLKVQNYSDEDIIVVYNTKMCSPSDATLWTGLKDLSFIEIPAKGTKEVTISENLLASHITFCHIRNGYKIITYADELYLDRSILNTTFNKLEYTEASSDMSIITKGGTKYAVLLTNTYGEDVDLYYNQKLCFEDDAKNWTGLGDVRGPIKLKPGESEPVIIEENVFATTIAVRFTSKTHEYYVYANGLSGDGSMTINRRTVLVAPTYLSLSNVGKSGGTWRIKITNPFSYSITVYYNEKMCFSDDAKNWTGLNDVVSVTISANSSKTVNISENWFATSIAISYITDGYRIISYADNLSTGGGIKVYHNNIKI